VNEDRLIESLKADLSPVRPAGAVAGVAVLWFLASVAYVLGLGVLLGPFRPGFGAELLEAPRFSLEMILGLAALGCFLVLSLREAVPGLPVAGLRGAAWTLLAVWLGQFLLGFAAPALEPSMLGKRDHCVWEAYLYSVPPLVWLIYLQRQRYVLEPVRAVGHAALAAGLLPALMMQIACMYEPSHILSFHVLPVVILAAFAIGLTWLLTRRAGS
jgi:hypothetical protein